MKVLLIAGSYPPAFCGVGEYTANLKHALAAEGIEAKVAALEGQPDFRYATRAGLLQIAHEFKPDIAHLQYPGHAFGATFVPLAFSGLGACPVLSLHEFRLSHPLRKAFSMRLVRRARALIVPARTELDAIPGIIRSRKPAEVIPVGPSFAPAQPPPLGRTPLLRFVFLGFINKSKDLTLWFEVILRLRDSTLPKPFSVFLGDPMGPESVRRFQGALRKLGLKEVVEILPQRPASEISGFLLHGAVGFLPFVDGASPRRTSLLTLLAHGVPVIVPPPVDPSLAGAGGLIAAGTPDSVIREMRRFAEATYFESQRRAALQLAARFSWPEIARRHRVFYNQIVRV
ncbi:MAG: hypothetical protein ACREJQ_00735 [bacterium]